MSLGSETQGECTCASTYVEHVVGCVCLLQEMYKPGPDQFGPQSSEGTLQIFFEVGRVAIEVFDLSGRRGFHLRRLSRSCICPYQLTYTT